MDEAHGEVVRGGIDMGVSFHGPLNYLVNRGWPKARAAHVSASLLRGPQLAKLR